MGGSSYGGLRGHDSSIGGRAARRAAGAGRGGVTHSSDGELVVARCRLPAGSRPDGNHRMEIADLRRDRNLRSSTDLTVISDLLPRRPYCLPLSDVPMGLEAGAVVQVSLARL